MRSGSRVKVKSEQIQSGIKSQVYTVVGDFEIDSPNRVVCFEDEYGYKRALRYSDLVVWEFVVMKLFIKGCIMKKRTYTC